MGTHLIHSSAYHP
jgi:hypothetical protein